jgi:acyl-[acyl-carrier-protein]-phospholipid O-acyltransferase/long-chain-fatty-acid--[acyl-carrier-protein] ligase
MSSNSLQSATGSPAPPTAEPGDGRGGLWSVSFVGLVVTQFLVALNDNMFRWLVIPVGKDLLGPGSAETSQASSAVALTAGLACFVLPFVVLAAPAGYLADRFSKRSVMIGCKVAEVVIMILGMVTILNGAIYWMFIVLFLMGGQSAIFSPSKYGSIPEIVRPDRISAANGVIGMTTMAAIILGTVAGNHLYVLTTPAAAAKMLPGTHRWWISAAALIGVATTGVAASLFIGRLRAANPKRSFPVNPFGETFRDLRALSAKRALLLASLGSAYFWSLGALAQVDIDQFAQFHLKVSQDYVGYLLGLLFIGIGLGSVLAGIWSGGRVELGLVPLGAAGIAACAILVSTVPKGVEHTISSGYYWTCVWLFTLGCTAGLYDIPLMAFLQDRSPKPSRGAILAANNFLTFSGMLVASAVFWLMAHQWQWSPRGMFLAAGLVTVPVCLLIGWLVLDRILYLVGKSLFRVFYRVRLRGLENVPKEGGALLVPNHITWIDGLLLVGFCPRPVRLVADPDYFSHWLIRRLARDFGVISISPGRRSVIRSIRNAREALRQGDLVCVFPEGGLSRTGQIHAFRPGFLTILKGTGAPVIPVHLGGLWGSVFSFERGKFFWKWPRRLPYPVSIRFGRPIHAPTGPQQVRLEVQELEMEAIREERRKKMPLRAFLRTARRSRRRAKVADSAGAEPAGLSGGALLVRTLILRRILRREVLTKDEKQVGILLPPSVAGVLANAALSLDRRVAVNLNYTVSSDVMNACIAGAGIRHVLTSRRVMEKLHLEIDAELVYMEDFRDQVRRIDKLIAAFQAHLVPVWALERWLGLTRIQPDDLLTVIFTSGSTGLPKGVMLTHHNVGSNVAAFDQVLRLSKRDVLIGVLPFFHSFGYTATLWSVLTLDPKGAYHYSPLEARQIGKLSKQHAGTILIATPTFLRTYVRRCEPDQFASLEVVVTGAEKLPSELADAFEKKFGVRPVEGYGTTELSPVVSCNIPPARMVGTFQESCREGTVGKPITGVSAKVVDLDTGEDLGVDEPGMLLVRGPNVMKGYLNQPERTAEVIQDGWYTTGDVATIDADGFIRITGRISRFSKIGGEMVPHVRIEEALADVFPTSDEAALQLVVMGVPDAKKGERLVVLHTGLNKPPERICRELAAAGLPPIWIPSPDSFCQVDAIPVLGSGKLDLRRAKELAEANFPAPGRQ